MRCVMAENETKPAVSALEDVDVQVAHVMSDTVNIAQDAQSHAKQTAEEFARVVRNKGSRFAKVVSGKSKEYASVAFEKSKVIAGNTIDKTKGFAEVTSLKMKVSSQKDMIKRNYVKLGEIFYLNNGEINKQDCIEIFSKIDDSLQKISEYENQIKNIK